MLAYQAGFEKMAMGTGTLATLATKGLRSRMAQILSKKAPGLGKSLQGTVDQGRRILTKLYQRNPQVAELGAIDDFYSALKPARQLSYDAGTVQHIPGIAKALN